LPPFIVAFMEPATAKAEEYRHQAEKADRLAEAASEEAEQQFYRTLAKRWREMADVAERQET
jgi:hypothetical protein